MPTLMLGRPKTFPTPLMGALERFFLVRLVRSGVCGEMGGANVARAACGADVGSLNGGGGSISAGGRHDGPTWHLLHRYERARVPAAWRALRMTCHTLPGDKGTFSAGSVSSPFYLPHPRSSCPPVHPHLQHPALPASERVSPGQTREGDYCPRQDRAWTRR